MIDGSNERGTEQVHRIAERPISLLSARLQMRAYVNRKQKLNEE